jgi:hypothetical protein
MTLTGSRKSALEDVASRAGARTSAAFRSLDPPQSFRMGSATRERVRLTAALCTSHLPAVKTGQIAGDTRVWTVKGCACRDHRGTLQLQLATSEPTGLTGSTRAHGKAEDR